ncbi:hypothetical protein ABEB36_012003 [Hypothenemus hampei]|uniref:CRAL-TRIO domain-containing protein n=1 Tax=Hypothenemus hampei TaxID=57062 RepID=A0ABD1EBS4_HYPHA
MSELKLEINKKIFYEKIEEEFGKTENDIEEYIELLHNWAKEQPHFPEIPSKHYCMFLMINHKFIMEKAKKNLDKLYAVKGIFPELFALHPLSPEMRLQSKIIYCVLLPKQTQEAERVLFIKFNPEYSPEMFVHEHNIMQIIHIGELLMTEEISTNYHLILDMDGAKFGHIPRFNPMTIKKGLICTEIYGNRMKSICIVNLPGFMENVYNTMFVPFLPYKIKNRVKIFKDSKMLLKLFDKSMLPRDVGGEEKCLDELSDMLLKKYETMKTRFDKIQFMTTNEELRPGKLENDELLGFYGSFKQINVD